MCRFETSVQPAPALSSPRLFDSAFPHFLISISVHPNKGSELIGFKSTNTITEPAQDKVVVLLYDALKGRDTRAGSASRCLGVDIFVFNFRFAHSCSCAAISVDSPAHLDTLQELTTSPATLPPFFKELQHEGTPLPGQPEPQAIQQQPLSEAHIHIQGRVQPQVSGTVLNAIAKSPSCGGKIPIPTRARSASQS